MACSATVPNLDDVGRWLGAPSPDGVRHFGEEYRPVRLETKVLGYDPAKNDWMFERRLNERLYEVVLNHFQSKPALVFCSSRARPPRRRSWRKKPGTRAATLSYEIKGSASPSAKRRAEPRTVSSKW